MRMERTVKAMKGMAEVDEEAEAIVLGVEMDVGTLHSVQTRVRVEDLEALDVEEAKLAVEEASHVVEVNLHWSRRKSVWAWRQSIWTP